VADASNAAVYEQITAAYRVLEEIGIESKDTLLVINKIDALPNRARLDGVLNRYPNAVAISARTGTGLKQLACEVSDALSRNFVDIHVETGVENGRLLAYLAKHGEVLSKRFNEQRVTVHCRISQRHLGRIREENGIVTNREGKSKDVA
jgi:GTP-binding protein HflX